MKIQRFGADVRSKTAEGILAEALLYKKGRLLLFPIPSTVDGLRVKGCEQNLEEALGNLGKDDIAVGYGLPEINTAGRIADVKNDGIFTEENAKITAAGALGVLLTKQNRVPGDLSVGVIGYGRIGRELVRMLLFFGAKVRVFTESAEKREELCSYGIACRESVASEACGRFSGLDVLFNTAPARLVLPEETGELAGVAVYELASGENLPKTVAFCRLASLPEAMYPVSAGKIYARSALRMIKNLSE